MKYTNESVKKKQDKLFLKRFNLKVPLKRMGMPQEAGALDLYCRKVLIKPNFIPDAVSIALFGPGVKNIVK